MQQRVTPGMGVAVSHQMTAAIILIKELIIEIVGMLSMGVQIIKQTLGAAVMQIATDFTNLS